MANQIISSYLADPSIPVEKRKAIAAGLNSGDLDENTAMKGITAKYGNKYGDIETEQKKTTPASKVGSAIGSLQGNLLNAAPKIASKILDTAVSAGKNMTDEDVAALNQQAKQEEEARQKKYADIQYLNKRGIAPDSSTSAEELGKAAQSVKFQTGDMFTEPVTKQVEKGVQATGEAIKSGVLKGAEGVQKVGAAVTGDTSNLEGFRSFYGIKSPEQAAADMQNLSPSDRATMLGTGLQNFVSGTVESATAPFIGATEAIPYGKETATAVGEHVFNPLVQEGSRQLKDKFKSMGINLTPEQEASIDEGVGNIANLLMIKTGEDSAKVAELEKIKYDMQKQIPDLIKKGDITGAKALIDKYEQATSATTTATGRAVNAVGEGVKSFTAPIAEGAKVLGQYGANKVGEAAKAAGDTISNLGSKIIDKSKLSESMLNSLIKVDPARGAEKFYKLSKGETLAKYLIDRDIIGTPEEVISGLADRFQKSKANYDNAVKQIEGNYRFDAAKTALEEMKTRFENTMDNANLNTVNNLLRKYDQEGLTMAENLELKRLYENKVKTGYLKDNNSVLVDRATNIDDALRTNFNKAAKESGFTNIEELSRETQLAKSAMDSIQSKAIRRLVNNQYSLTDNLLLVGGAINPAAISALGFKKILSTPSIQARIIKSLASGDLKAMKDVPGVPTSIIQEANAAKRQAAFESWLMNSDLGKVLNNKENLALPEGSSIQTPPPTAENIRLARAEQYRAGEGIFKDSVQPIDEKAYSIAAKNGGVTIDLSGESPTKGYAYSPYKDSETIVPSSKFSAKDITDFRNKFADRLNQPGNHLGIWEDQGNMYMDVSTVGTPTPETIAAAEAAGQLGVFDLEKFETIKTKLYKEPTKPLASEGASTVKSQTKTYQPSTIEEHFKAAEPAKLEIDKQADEVAKKYGAIVAKAPLKGMERAAIKVVEDYAGDFTQLKDVARNTIIAVKDGTFEKIFADVSKGKNVEKASLITPEKNPLGYSGANIKIKTSNGHIAETQVNSPIMIYAKEAAKDAIKLLGEELYNKIKDKVGIEGGRGHKYYERWRSIKYPKNYAQRSQKEAIEQKSRNYYQSIRDAWAK